jgi:hypothetical protein
LRQPRGVAIDVVGTRCERGAGVFIGGFWLALGARVCEMEVDRTEAVIGVSREDSSRMMRCLMGGATYRRLDGGAAYRFGRGG